MCFLPYCMVQNAGEEHRKTAKDSLDSTPNVYKKNMYKDKLASKVIQ